MKKTLLVILLGSRKASAVRVQKILTAWGCLIKTRLGIHDGVLNNCSDSGLVILELAGEAARKKELARKLKLVRGVTVKLLELSVKDKK